jgi:hypothetical protein
VDVRPLRIVERCGDQHQSFRSFTLSAAGVQRESSPSRSPRPSLLSYHVWWHWLRGVLSALFLPVGFPSSVTEDYFEFQCWDTLQALCSYLRGMLCTHAVLVGMGVGESTASATSATLSWVLRDGLGMLGSMIFAWWGSISFGHNVKGWRLFADCINDVGLTLELVSPLFPRSYFLLFLAAACVCRSMCGVSSGATRAALMAHFARAGNTADLAAKEGQQETFVTLLGMVGGAAVMWWLDGAVRATWILFAALTALHVYANWRAVTALCLRTLNPQRTDILLHHRIDWLLAQADTDADDHAASAAASVLSPAEVACKEHLVWCAPTHSVRLGVAMHDHVAGVALAGQIIAAMPSDSEALLCPPLRAEEPVCVVLRTGCSEHAQLRSLLLGMVYRALLVRARHASSSPAVRPSRSWCGAPHSSPRSALLRSWELQLLEQSLRLVDGPAAPGGGFEAFVHQLCAKGWELDNIALHTEAWRCEWDEQRKNIDK